MLAEEVHLGAFAVEIGVFVVAVYAIANDKPAMVEQLANTFYLAISDGNDLEGGLLA